MASYLVEEPDSDGSTEAELSDSREEMEEDSEIVEGTEEETEEEAAVEEENEEEAEEEAEVIPGAAGGAGAGGKKARLSRRKKKVSEEKKKADNRFALDDKYDVSVLQLGIEGVMEGLVKCAKVGLTGMTGSSESKKERNARVKKIHEVVQAVVGAKLKIGLVEDVVNSVFDNLDMETVAGQEEDDEQFMALLESFEESCVEEMKKRCKKNVGPKEIDKDQQYQNCLEVLNEFVERKKGTAEPSGPTAGPSSKAGPKKKATIPNVEGSFSEGLEALDEFIPTCDPVTKRIFTEPIVNTVCGHVYEYRAILGLIGTGKSRCPYVGCTNTKPVGFSDLKKDAELERKIFDKIRRDELD